MDSSIIIIDSDSSNQHTQELNDIDKITQMEAALEDLIFKLEYLTKIEQENVRKVDNQNKQIQALQEENTVLREENDNLHQAMDGYLKELVQKTNNIQENMTMEDVEVLNTAEKLMSEKNQIISQLETQKIQLEDANKLLTAESEDLKAKLDKMTADYEHVNKFISDSFETTLQHTHLQKIKELEIKVQDYEEIHGKLKNKRNRSSSNVVVLINGDQVAKSPVVTTRSKKTANGGGNRKSPKYRLSENIDDEDEIEDSNYSDNSNKDSFSDYEGEDFSPRRGGGRRKGVVTKKPPQNKKQKKNESKELQMMNKNIIQYHLFN